MLGLDGLPAVAVALLLGYALGNVMGGFVVGALKGGVDLRTTGSGNVGATNALRTQGKAFAAGVLLIDVLKGVLAVLCVPALVSRDPALAATLPFAVGAAAAIGHCYPVLYRFQGGKGVATLAGVFAVLLPAAVGWMLAGFVAVVILTGYVSLATLAATALALFHVTCIDSRGLFSVPGAFVTAMVVLVVWKHRSNIRALAQGHEHRFEKARLFHRR